MRLFSLAFLLGVLLLQNFSHLPDKKWVWIILAISIASAVCWKYLRLLIACLLGFAWCLWFSHLHMSWGLPEDLEGKTLSATGYIASIPNTSQPHLISFLFDIKNIEYNDNKIPAHGLVRLTWRGEASHIHVGDVWRLTVRLKKIHGTLNPGSFDYEAWALQEGIRANGYVVNFADNHVLSSCWFDYSIDRVRQFLKEKIEKNLPLSNTSPWILALSLGVRNGISEENWEVLRNTGTNHLMAIAGLHIGFMSGFAYAVTAWLWRRRPSLILKIPAQHAGSVAALLIAIIYSMLAGFSIPTQRACWMFLAFLMTLLLRRKIIAWQAWSVALLIVLLTNPLCVLTESFWLSFGAVAFIIYGVSGRLAPTGLWWKYGRIQWVIAVGLIPLSFWLFQQCSIISFVANSIAIPWVGFLVEPLCLLGTVASLVSAKLGGIILTLADKTLSILWVILTWFSHLSWASWYQVVPNTGILIAACVGIFFLILPKGFPGRYLGLIGLLPLFLYKNPAPPLGEVWLTLLDVGQGLSTVIQTRHHILVFDAGPKLSPSFDMGESVVVPFLRTLHAKQINMLVVSHGDNDHIGGAPAILKRFPVQAVKTSVPEKFPIQQKSFCLRGQRWEWDHVKFEFLYPTLDNLGLNNDSSCVLRISSGDHHILLTGDIEKYAEKYLVDNELEKISADILVAPHHGSKTSAVDAFLQAVRPKYVLFPVGYRNRYHFPNISVVAKYDALGTEKIDTVKSGAIQIKLSDQGLIALPGLYRVLHCRYWNNEC